MAYPVSQHNEPVICTATIASGASLSGAVEVPRGCALVGISMPSTWTAAALTFQAAVINIYQNAYTTAGAAISYTAGAAQALPVDPAQWKHAAKLKVRSGTAGSPVNQAADRILTLVFRPV